MAKQEIKKFKTDSGIPVKRNFSSKDLTNISDNEEPANIRIQGDFIPTCARRMWTMRRCSGFGSAEETNNRFRFLLEHGQTGLSLAFDLPTQTGRDSDNPYSRGEVGRTGVAIGSIDNMMTCFQNIPLDKVRKLSMTINSTASTLLSLYIVVAESRGVSSNNLEIATQNDILKEYIKRLLSYTAVSSKRVDENHWRYDSVLLKTCSSVVSDKHLWISYAGGRFECYSRVKLLHSPMQ